MRTIKEKACYLSNNPAKEESGDTESINYTLPDGSSIKIGPARFRAPEILFKPDLIGCFGFMQPVASIFIKVVFRGGMRRTARSATLFNSKI